jgi:hypothetical protein
MAKGKFHKWITEEGLLQLEGMARDGLTDEQIAHNIGIGASTLYKWKIDFPEIVEALKRGKEVVDRKTENALLKRALGYQHQEITYTPEIDPETGKKVQVVSKIVTKEMPPDVTAIIFWLKNRKPFEWRDQKRIEVEGQINNPMSGLTTAELKRIAANLKI